MQNLLQVEMRTWITLGISLFLLIGALQVLADQSYTETKDQKSKKNRK